jgi:NAD(P)-dependent dehydrogenase (short-subunit alcohol dehydrogenase family)
LILAVRSVAKGKRVAQEFRAKYPNATIEVWELEMSDYDSVIAFSKRVAAEFDNNSSAVEAEPKEHQQRKKARLDIAVLNAGMTGATFTKDKKTGHCEVVQVNYLSTMLLSVLLMPVVRDEAGVNPGRLCIVGSGASHMAKLPNRHKRPFLASFDDPAVQPWEPAERYFASKALGMLFFVRLIDYLPSPDELVVNLVDPGYCKGTDLHRDAKGLMRIMLSATKELTGRPLEDGAWTYVDAAVVKGKESHGCFVMDWDIRP